MERIQKLCQKAIDLTIEDNQKCVEKAINYINSSFNVNKILIESIEEQFLQHSDAFL